MTNHYALEGARILFMFEAVYAPQHVSQTEDDECDYQRTDFFLEHIFVSRGTAGLLLFLTYSVEKKEYAEEKDQ